MNFLLRRLTMLPLIVFLCASAGAQDQPGIYLKGTVTEILSGDTIGVDLDGTVVTVVLAGVDLGGLSETEVSAARSRLVEHLYLRQAEVRLEEMFDSYLVGRPYVDGQDIIEVFLAGGMVIRPNRQMTEGRGQQPRQEADGNGAPAGLRRYVSESGRPVSGVVYEFIEDIPMSPGFHVIESDEADAARERSERLEADEERRRAVTQVEYGGKASETGGTIQRYTATDDRVYVVVTTGPGTSGTGQIGVVLRDASGDSRETTVAYSWNQGDQNVTVVVRKPFDTEVITVVPR